MILKFSGLVTVDNICVCEEQHDDEVEISIGDTAVTSEIEYTKFSDTVTVAIADEQFTGDDLYADGAWMGYSEWTPSSPDELTLSGVDLIPVLRRYEGQHITMWIADEPVNVLD